MITVTYTERMVVNNGELVETELECSEPIVVVFQPQDIEIYDADYDEELEYDQTFTLENTINERGNKCVKPLAKIKIMKDGEVIETKIPEGTIEISFYISKEVDEQLHKW